MTELKKWNNLDTLDTSRVVNMSEMFKGCESLTSVTLNSNYEFSINNKVIIFTHNEVERLQKVISNFKFKDKDILRLRKITDCYLKEFHPEDLL